MFENTAKKISSIFKTLSGNSKISEKNVEDAVEEIKIALLDADVNLRVVRRFINSTLEEVKGQRVISSINPSQQFIKIVLDKITQLLSNAGDSKLRLKDKSQLSVILMMGLQGNGKTTSAAKLAKRLKKEGRRVMLAACDLVRPAAVDQLEILAKSIDVPVYVNREQKDPVCVAKEAVSFAKKELYDTLIIDTSGRMNIDETLMRELENIKDAVNAQESIFVSDSMLGQQAANVAADFDKIVPITGVILTKFDSDTRGGAAMSIASVTSKPIKFVGTGEKMDDLELFHADRVARSILGMGDVISLVEKAQSQISEKEAEKLAGNIKSGNFTITDYLGQLEMMNKMGGMKKILGMLPGLSSINTSQINAAGGEIKKEKAIIYSMTKKERDNFRIIGPPRRKRIAEGSGTSPADVDRFLRKFDKMRLTMQKFSKNSKFQSDLMQKIGINDIL